MIQANELRVNNWVHSVNHKEDYQINLIDIYENYEHIEPIPLTEEWLLKCGFTGLDYNSHIQYGHNLFWQLTYYKDAKTYVFEELECEIKYLHQLQNLYFAITGKELEIKL